VAAGLNSALLPEVPGPFWGCPPRQRRPELLPTSPGFPYRAGSGRLLERTRAAEARLTGTQETWKLLGVGSVGSQALLGIPRLCRLRDHPALAPHSRVWPFETGFTAAPTGAARIVHAEIWPGIVRDRVAERLAREPRSIKDSIQVAELAKWAAALDARGELADCFAAPALDAATRAACVAEEGWVLGA
jgi:hypothetical protein